MEILNYFDLLINKDGDINLKLKKEFKKAIPKEFAKELRGPCLNYYKFQLGEEIGEKIFNQRKEIFGKTKLSNFVLENKLYDSEEQKTVILESLEKHSKKIKDGVKDKTWSNPSYREKILKSRELTWKDPLIREKRRQNWLQKYWNTEKSKLHREKLSTNPNRFNLVNWQKENGVRHKKNLYDYQGKKINEIEFIFCGLLNNFNLFYEMEYLISIDDKNYFVDFYLPKEKIVIEVFGDYWHANSKYYKKNDYIKDKLAEEIWRDDNKRKEKLTNNGYNYISFWESEIRINTKYIIEFLKLIKENEKNKN